MGSQDSSTEPVILAVNAGSSSVKIAIHAAGTPHACLLAGQVSGIGARVEADGVLVQAFGRALPANALNHEAVLAWLFEGAGDWCNGSGRQIAACGHRVVHGGEALARHMVVDGEVEAEIGRLIPLARSHNPHNLAAIRAARRTFSGAVHVACFDTAFHATQPEEAVTMALPEAVRAMGVRRYGFHGLSYQSVSEQLAGFAGGLPRRIIIAHLGNGASLCGLHDGRSVATTMGFTPLDGLIMGTRPGLLDPGVVPFLLRESGMTLEEIEEMLTRESGLKGLSGISSDMRDLEASRQPAAALALSLYAYRIGRESGSLAAALQGVDAFVFTGGVGENSAKMRSRIAAHLAWLGAELDEAANASLVNAGRASEGVSVVSTPQSRIRIMVVRTGEESVIVRETARLAGL